MRGMWDALGSLTHWIGGECSQGLGSFQLIQLGFHTMTSSRDNLLQRKLERQRTVAVCTIETSGSPILSVLVSMEAVRAYQLPSSLQLSAPHIP